MRSIEQMLAEGDFDAIRQLVDKEEAEAKRKGGTRKIFTRERKRD